MSSKHLSSIATLLVILLVPAYLMQASSAKASSPMVSGIAFCTKGFNSKKACKNPQAWWKEHTSWGPVTLRLALRPGKLYLYQPCVPWQSDFSTGCKYKAHWVKPMAVRRAILPNTYDYQMYFPSNLDKVGQTVQASGNFFPANGRGCVYGMVRYRYCKVKVAVRVTSYTQS